MAWSDPRGDLRKFLCDTLADNLVKEQKVFGPQNGSNRTFFTFQDRLTTSGYQSAIQSTMVPLRAFLNQAELAASGILVTHSERGEFQLMALPAVGDELLVSYHFRQHLDDELDFYLQQAALLVNTDAIGNVPVGLQSAALNLAASMAHERLAQRWSYRKSDQFMLHDQPARSEAEARVAFHREEATRLMVLGRELRREYYELRMDKGRAPAQAVFRRQPSRIGPQR